MVTVSPKRYLAKDTVGSSKDPVFGCLVLCTHPLDTVGLHHRQVTYVTQIRGANAVKCLEFIIFDYFVRFILVS